MADNETPPGSAGPASEPTVGATGDAGELATPKRKVTKKKVVKKKATKKAKAIRAAPVGDAVAAATVAAAPHPPPVAEARDEPAESLPVWDEDTSEGTLVKLVIHWGPLLLLLLLVLVLDRPESGGPAAEAPLVSPSSETAETGSSGKDGRPSDVPAAQTAGATAETGSSGATAGGSSGAIPVPEGFNPWTTQDWQGYGSITPGAGLIDPLTGMDLSAPAPWLQDPAAVFWGPGAGQELLSAPPPPTESE
jgi:hypothetical protein